MPAGNGEAPDADARAEDFARRAAAYIELWERHLMHLAAQGAPLPRPPRPGGRAPGPATRPSANPAADAAADPAAGPSADPSADPAPDQAADPPADPATDPATGA